MPFELFNCPEVFLACRTPGLHDVVFLAHERIQIVALYFVLNCPQQLRLLHESHSGGQHRPSLLALNNKLIPLVAGVKKIALSKVGETSFCLSHIDGQEELIAVDNGPISIPCRHPELVPINCLSDELFVMPETCCCVE